VLALVAWALFAVLAPTLLGIDHQGLLSIYRAGDHTALSTTLHSFTRYPLKTLAPIAVVVGFVGLAGARLWRNQPGDAPNSPGDARNRPGDAGKRPGERRSQSTDAGERVGGSRAMTLARPAR
jgi:hypothetical protein